MTDPWTLEPQDIAGPGPSATHVCPVCGTQWRELRFVRVITPPCPTCQAVDRDRQAQAQRARWEAQA